MQVEHRLGKALASDVSTPDFLDRNPTGVVLIDGLGRVVLANAAARRMAARADSFALRTEGMAALRPRDDQALQRLIGAALRSSAGDGLSSGGTLRLPRRTGQRDYVAIVAPFPRRASILAELLPSACILVSDPAATPPLPSEALRHFYGLTPREMRLIERLIAGDSLSVAAASLGITVITARSHLAAIFRKTETNRQPELLRLMLTPPWWALNDGSGSS